MAKGGEEAFRAAARGTGVFGELGDYFRGPTARSGEKAATRPGAWPTASPYDFEPTDSPGASISGLRRIVGIRRRMRENGYAGPPIKVVVHEGRKFVVDGNNRLRAAEGVLDQIPYRTVDLPFLGYKDIYDVTEGLDLCREMLPGWMARRAKMR